MKLTTIGNRFVSLSVDERGRLVSLKDRITGAESITHPEAAEGWRMVLPAGLLGLDIVCASGQRPARIGIEKRAGSQSLVIQYPALLVGGKKAAIRVECRFALAAESRVILARAALANHSGRAVQEFEFPVLGGLGGFAAADRKRHLELVVASDRGAFFGDVLNNGLPRTGAEAHHFVRDYETAFFEPRSPFTHGQDHGFWLELYAARAGLYLGVHQDSRERFAWKIEKFPRETPHALRHYYPPGTPRWLRAAALHLPNRSAGRSWTSPEVQLMPHRGDWHAGADHFSAYRRRNLAALAAPPKWMEDFVGWTEILGWPCTHQIYHTFRRCADAIIKDEKVTGLNLVFLYGHTALGSEGADFDNGPARELGGAAGFRALAAALHRRGIRIILLDHLHRYVNREIPEFKRFKLEQCAVLKADGAPETSREWGKETFLSLRRAQGSTPHWIEMCPGSPKWQEIYLKHVGRMIKLGADGLEVDLFSYPYTHCHNPRHGHAPGMSTFALRMEFFRKVRAYAKALNPDFLLMGETTAPEARAVLDAFYPTRYLDEDGRIYRYLFPELTQQAVLVGDYAYDQVNKALGLGLGVETEVQGLRQTTLAACPELARYIGSVNRFRRKHAELMIHGVFRDTLGARVQGDLLHSVLEGKDGSRAVVLRNPRDRRGAGEVLLNDWRNKRLLLWQPGRGESRVRSLPVKVTLGPYAAAVLLAINFGEAKN